MFPRTPTRSTVAAGVETASPDHPVRTSPSSLGQTPSPDSVPVTAFGSVLSGAADNAHGNLSDSDADEQLGSETDGSSVGHGSEVGAPGASDFIEIQEDMCRVPCSVEARKGRRIAGLCGKPRSGPNALQGL